VVLGTSGKESVRPETLVGPIRGRKGGGVRWTEGL